MDRRFSVTVDIDGDLSEANDLSEAARYTRSLTAAMLLDETIAHFDWRGRLKRGKESKFSQWMKKARLGVWRDI